MHGRSENILRILFWSGNETLSAMWKVIIGVIPLLVIQPKPGQHFVVGFRNGTFVIPERVLANRHGGPVLFEGLCQQMKNHSLLTGTTGMPLWKLTRMKNERQVRKITEDVCLMYRLPFTARQHRQNPSE